MDPVKIIIFIGAFVALLLIGRLLVSASEVHASSLPRRGLAPPQPEASDAGRSPLTGAEFGFPIRIPPVTRFEDGTYNRPNFLDYYFSKTDLASGPADPDCFFDELCLKAEDPGNGRRWDYHFTVATTSGLRKVMEDEKFVSLYLDGGAVIVPRWDLANILHTVVDEIMKAYRHKHVEEHAANRESGSEPA